MFKRIRSISLVITIMLFVSLLSGLYPAQLVDSAEKAVPEDTYFSPLTAGKATQVYFYFKNTSKKE